MAIEGYQVARNDGHNGSSAGVCHLAYRDYFRVPVANAQDAKMVRKRGELEAELRPSQT